MDQADFVTGILPFVQTAPDSKDEDTPWAAPRLAALSPLSRAPPIVVASTVNSRALSYGPGLLSKAPVATFLLKSQSRPAPFWTGVWEEKSSARYQSLGSGQGFFVESDASFRASGKFPSAVGGNYLECLKRARSA